MLGCETAGHMVWLAGDGMRHQFEVLQEERGERYHIYRTLADGGCDGLSYGIGT